MNDIILSEDSINALSRLSDKEAGVLLKTLIRHMKGIETENLPDNVALVYPFVVNQVERSLSLREKNRANGSLGGRPRKNPNETQTKPKNNPTKTQTKPVGFEIENPNKTQNKPSNGHDTNSVNNYSSFSDLVLKEKEKESEKKDKKKIDLPDTGIWSDADVRTAFTEYAKMRIRIKKSLTPEAVKRKIPKLEAMTSDPAKAVEIIHEATDNCWLDFYDTTNKSGKKQTFNFTERKTDYDSFLNAMGV